MRRFLSIPRGRARTAANRANALPEIDSHEHPGWEQRTRQAEIARQGGLPTRIADARCRTRRSATWKAGVTTSLNRRRERPRRRAVWMAARQRPSAVRTGGMMAPRRCERTPSTPSPRHRHGVERGRIARPRVGPIAVRTQEPLAHEAVERGAAQHRADPAQALDLRRREAHARHIRVLSPNVLYRLVV